MNITVIVPPPFEPVSILEVYKQLRLDPDVSSSPAEISHPDDAMLSAQIMAAREFVEIATRRSLVLQTLRLSCSGADARHGFRWRGHSQPILLRRPPLVRVESVQYYDAANVLQMVDAAEYYVTDDQVPELRFTSGFCLPYQTCERPYALRVEYVAGYAPDGSPPTTQQEYAANIPQTLKQAVLIGVQLQYDNLSQSDREAMEKMREAMLQSKRIQHT